jgi:DNA-3-methyladenine glycosylase I
VHDDRTLFEFLVLEGAQAGLSWWTVLRKREAYRKAFDGFDPERVARFRAARVAALLRDPGIIRNRAKVASAVENAKAFLEVQREHGSFDAFAWSFVGGKPIRRRPRSLRDIPATTPESDAFSKALRERGLPVRGLDDLLRLHAGLRPRGRPRPGMLPGEAPLRHHPRSASAVAGT